MMANQVKKRHPTFKMFYYIKCKQFSKIKEKGIKNKIITNKNWKISKFHPSNNRY